jgi:hypothetical protein
MNSIEFKNIFLPLYLDYNPETEKVTFEKPEFGTREYYIDHLCFLEIDKYDDWVYIDYYSDADIMLSELLDLDTDCIAKGCLKKDSFEHIQNKALKVLSQFMENAEEEIMELFET